MSYLKGSNRIKLKAFRKLEFILSILTMSFLTSCSDIAYLIAGKRNTPIVSYSECWRSTTPLNGKYYVQRVVLYNVKSSNPNYLFKDVLARLEVDQERNTINLSEEFAQDELLFLYASPRDDSSSYSESFVEIPYQLESQANELLEKGVIKFNINEMTVQDDLNSQTYHMKPCTSFKNR